MGDMMAKENSVKEDLSKTAKRTNQDIKSITTKAIGELQDQAEIQRQRARALVAKNPTKSVAIALAAGVIIGSAVTMVASRAKT